MHEHQHKVCLQSSDLSVYLCGEIPNKLKAALEEHLCRCENCFEKLITVLNPHLNESEFKNDV